MWILFVWIYMSPGHPVSVTSQEFSSRKACVQTARSLEANLGQSMGFLCLEKGATKK